MEERNPLSAPIAELERSVLFALLIRYISRMAETHVNTFGGSPLNRLSWLRPSHPFLNALVTLPSTRWLLFNAGQPLVTPAPSSPSRIAPVFLSTQDVQSLLGPLPFFGQAQEPGTEVSEENAGPHSPTEAIRHRGGRIVFLGLHETGKGGGAALPSSEFKDPEEAVKRLEGTPYFALDVADLDVGSGEVDEVLRGAKEGVSWSEPRALMSGLDQFNAAVFASARSLVDWNFRNKFCPACGSPTYSMWGGWKISCSSLLPWADNTGRKPCPTVKGLHNFTHPRTDSVVIMIAIDETGEKVLLGRGRKFPGKFYSALAGFIEPGESFEDAVAREMWEEAGVKVWSVRYHSGQPWPFPANLMVGFYARADSSQVIRTDLDNELVDARWFTRAEVLAVLSHSAGTQFTRADNKKITELIEGRSNLPGHAGDVKALAGDAKAVEEVQKEKREGGEEETPFRLPPVTAIAGVLIRDWAEGRIGFPKEGGNRAEVQNSNL